MEKAVLKGNRILVPSINSELIVDVKKDNVRGWTGYYFYVENIYPREGYQSFVGELESNNYPPDYQYTYGDLSLKSNTVQPKIGNKTFWIKNIRIDNPYRRLGIATALYTYAKNWLKSRGFNLEHENEFTDEGMAWRNSLSHIKSVLIKLCSELLQEPEHQALQSSEYKKTDITDEKELTTYPKNKSRADSEVKHIKSILKQIVN